MRSQFLGGERGGSAFCVMTVHGDFVLVWIRSCFRNFRAEFWQIWLGFAGYLDWIGIGAISVARRLGLVLNKRFCWKRFGLNFCWLLFWNYNFGSENSGLTKFGAVGICGFRYVMLIILLIESFGSDSLGPSYIVLVLGDLQILVLYPCVMIGVYILLYIWGAQCIWEFCWEFVCRLSEEREKH